WCRCRRSPRARSVEGLNTCAWRVRGYYNGAVLNHIQSPLRAMEDCHTNEDPAMPNASASPLAADRNLLFGVLALQMDFVTRDALVRGMNAWVLDKHKPLAHVLQEQGALAPDARALLEPLVEKHLQIHGDDPQRSLAAVSSVGSVRDELERIADPDVQASLAHLAAPTPSDDPHATRDRPAGPRVSGGDPHATPDYTGGTPGAGQ